MVRSMIAMATVATLIDLGPLIFDVPLFSGDEFSRDPNFLLPALHNAEVQNSFLYLFAMTVPMLCDVLAYVIHRDSFFYSERAIILCAFAVPLLVGLNSPPSHLFEKIFLCLQAIQTVWIAGALLSGMLRSKTNVWTNRRVSILYLCICVLQALIPYTELGGNDGYKILCTCNAGFALFCMFLAYHYCWYVYALFYSPNGETATPSRASTLSAEEYLPLLCSTMIVGYCFFFIAGAITWNVTYPHSVTAQALEYNLTLIGAITIIVTLLPGRIARSQVREVESYLENKKSFIRYIGHEIRTPLNVATIGLDLLVADFMSTKNSDGPALAPALPSASQCVSRLDSVGEEGSTRLQSHASPSHAQSHMQSRSQSGLFPARQTVSQTTIHNGNPAANPAPNATASLSGKGGVHDIETLMSKLHAVASAQQLQIDREENHGHNKDGMGTNCVGPLQQHQTAPPRKMSTSSNVSSAAPESRNSVPKLNIQAMFERQMTENGSRASATSNSSLQTYHTSLSNASNGNNAQAPKKTGSGDGPPPPREINANGQTSAGQPKGNHPHPQPQQQGEMNSSERSNIINEIRHAVALSTDILNDLLSFDKLETNNMSLERALINTHDFIRSSLSIFEIQAQAKKVKFVVNVGPNVTPELYADEYKMRQVLCNLASNALKFTQSGGCVCVDVRAVSAKVFAKHKRQVNAPPKTSRLANSRCQKVLQALGLSATPPPPPASHEDTNGHQSPTRTAELPRLPSMLTRTDTDGQNPQSPTSNSAAGSSLPYLCISVRDNGVGIAEENICKVFKKIIQFDANKNQAGKGSGLGLYITRGLVELHGGCVSVHSEGLGKGCVFMVCIPFGTDSTQSLLQKQSTMISRACKWVAQCVGLRQRLQSSSVHQSTDEADIESVPIPSNKKSKKSTPTMFEEPSTAMAASDSPTRRMGGGVFSSRSVHSTRVVPVTVLEADPAVGSVPSQSSSIGTGSTAAAGAANNNNRSQLVRAFTDTSSDAFDGQHSSKQLSVNLDMPVGVGSGSGAVGGTGSVESNTPAFMALRLSPPTSSSNTPNHSPVRRLGSDPQSTHNNANSNHNNVGTIRDGLPLTHVQHTHPHHAAAHMSDTNNSSNHNSNNSSSGNTLVLVSAASSISHPLSARTGAGAVQAAAAAASMGNNSPSYTSRTDVASARLTARASLNATTWLDGFTVLLVDDSASSLKMMKMLMRRLGCKCECAEDGVEAVRLVQESLAGCSGHSPRQQQQPQLTQGRLHMFHPHHAGSGHLTATAGSNEPFESARSSASNPSAESARSNNSNHSDRDKTAGGGGGGGRGGYDFVMMDNFMPVMSGPEACRQMRAMGYDRPVVGLTGHALGDDVVGYKAAGATDVLCKPLDVIRLQEVLIRCKMLSSPPAQ